MYEYKTLKKPAVSEIIEKKSRFIVNVMPVVTEQEAIDFIQSVKSKHYSATHNVYAYVLRDNNIQRYSDDGEPTGTAGVPTLDVIRKESLVDVCIVITRYFGGTLLGAGGLVRAYTKAAKAGVDEAGILNRYFCFEYNVKAAYTMLGKVQSEAHLLNCIAGNIEYTNEVKLTYYVPYNVTNFEERIIDITNGQAIIKKQTEGRFIDVI